MKTIRWRELKEFANTLNDEQLDTVVTVVIGEESREIEEILTVDEDLYVHKQDNEDVGTLEDLEVELGEDFDENDYKLATKAGTPFLTTWD